MDLLVNLFIKIGKMSKNYKDIPVDDLKAIWDPEIRDVCCDKIACNQWRTPMTRCKDCPIRNRYPKDALKQTLELGSLVAFRFLNKVYKGWIVFIQSDNKVIIHVTGDHEIENPVKPGKFLKYFNRFPRNVVLIEDQFRGADKSLWI